LSFMRRPPRQTASGLVCGFNLSPRVFLRAPPASWLDTGPKAYVAVVRRVPTDVGLDGRGLGECSAFWCTRSCWRRPRTKVSVGLTCRNHQVFAKLAEPQQGWGFSADGAAHDIGRQSAPAPRAERAGPDRTPLNVCNWGGYKPGVWSYLSTRSRGDTVR
jgi:hypothetical protein